MNWPNNFSARLDSWYHLRQNLPADTESALDQINQWWFRCPWQPYYLHWDDIQIWPDPWQLLADNYFCDIARGLGILYTISLLERKDMKTAELIETNLGNLVLVNKRKYILNYVNHSIVNNKLEFIAGKHRITQDQLKNIIK